MQTQCNSDRIEFQGFGRRKVQAAFDGGHISSDGGALLLRDVDRRFGVTSGIAKCFTDHRRADLIEHTVLELLRQRIYGIALGYEDLNDHDELRHDPLLAMIAGKRHPEGDHRRRSCDRGKALASSSTLNRLELTPADADVESRYKKIVYHPEQIEDLLITLFLDSYERTLKEIVLDFDATTRRSRRSFLSRLLSLLLLSAAVRDVWGPSPCVEVAHCGQGREQRCDGSVGSSRRTHSGTLA